MTSGLSPTDGVGMLGPSHPLHRLAEEQVKRRYKLGLGISETEYDYKIAEVLLTYSAGGRSELEMEATAR